MSGDNSLDIWLERLKKLVEIVAILIAGIWVYIHFLVVEAPLTVTRVGSTTKLIWEKRDDISCYANYKVSVKNLGINPFEVKRVRVEVRDFSEPPFEKGNNIVAVRMPDFRNLDEVDDSRVIQTSRSEKSLLGVYSAGVSDDSDFTFIVESQGKGVLVYMTIFLKGETDPWWFYHWSSRCDYESNQPTKKT